jgi:hypothetical protein
MDFGKMKVIELRAELQARGLDTKGNFFFDCLASDALKISFFPFNF